MAKMLILTTRFVDAVCDVHSAALDIARTLSFVCRHQYAVYDFPRPTETRLSH